MLARSFPGLHRYQDVNSPWDKPGGVDLAHFKHSRRTPQTEVRDDVAAFACDRVAHRYPQGSLDVEIGVRVAFGLPQQKLLIETQETSREVKRADLLVCIVGKGRSIFEGRFTPLLGQDADAVYGDILRRMFNSDSRQRLKLRASSIQKPRYPSRGRGWTASRAVAQQRNSKLGRKT